MGWSGSSSGPRRCWGSWAPWWGSPRLSATWTPQLLATNIQEAMEGLLAGLYVAFDTTALALTLSMALMFIQFLIDRMETQVLSTVDLRANETLAGRFEQFGRQPRSVPGLRRPDVPAVVQATADAGPAAGGNSGSPPSMRPISTGPS